MRIEWVGGKGLVDGEEIFSLEQRGGQFCVCGVSRSSPVVAGRTSAAACRGAQEYLQRNPGYVAEELEARRRVRAEELETERSANLLQAVIGRAGLQNVLIVHPDASPLDRTMCSAWLTDDCESVVSVTSNAQAWHLTLVATRGRVYMTTRVATTAPICVKRCAIGLQKIQQWQESCAVAAASLGAGFELPTNI